MATATKKKQRIRVSDHAIVRFLERVAKVDMDEVRRNIVGEQQASLIEKFGGGEFPVTNKTLGDFRIVVQEGTVVTVLTPDE